MLIKVKVNNNNNIISRNILRDNNNSGFGPGYTNGEKILSYEGICQVK
jgi:hypothetical protein